MSAALFLWLSSPPNEEGWCLRFMESPDLQNWMPIETMNRGWFLAVPHELTAAVDSLSANLLGERAGVRWCSGS